MKECFNETIEACDCIYQPHIIKTGIRTSQDIALIQDHFRRRHEQFSVKFGWESIKADGMEQDSYDRFGLCDYVLLANEEKRVGAGCRLIWSTPSVHLPIAQFLEDSHTVPIGSVEISRITGTPETAKHSLSFLGYLLGYLSERKVPGIYLTIRKRLLERYAHSGFHCYELLPGRALEKTSRNGNKEYFLPVWIDIKGYTQALSIIARLCF